MVRPAEQLMIAFDGGGAGEGEFSWGQREWWDAMSLEGSWWPMGGVTPLPTGMTLDQVADAIQYQLNRYPTLRTRVRHAPGARRPTQVVHAYGKFALDVIDAEDADPVEAAEQLRRRYTTTELDYAADWPLRIGVLLGRGKPSHIVSLVCHLSVDAQGMALMIAETVSRTAAPVAGLSPLDQATWQRSPAGRRQNAAALRYWEAVLRAIPPRRWEDPRPGPRYWHGEFDTYRLLPAVRAIAERTGIGTSTVLTTLYAVALHDLTDVNPVMVRPMVDNRFRPGLAGVVCTVAQDGVCLLDVADVPFDQALRRAARSVLSAQKHAYADPWGIAELTARIQHERGHELDPGAFINDRRDIGIFAPTSPAAHGDPASPAPSTFRWIDHQHTPLSKPLSLEIDDIPGALRLTMHIDTHMIIPTVAEALVRRIEDTALAVAVSSS